MSVYISGFKIPQDGRVTLQIDSNGGVYVVNKFSIASEKYEKSMTATEIQPHGRLIDADNIYIDGEGYFWFSEYEAPTIIEAEE